MTDTDTGSPPRVGIDPQACAALTRATSPSARRADAGTWSAWERNRSANASIAAITASPSRRGSTPDRTTESDVSANDTDRASWAAASSGSGSPGGVRTRITRATNAATAAGDNSPHHGPNSVITAAICTVVSRSACRARASTCSLVITPAAHTPPNAGCTSANAPARARRRAHPADQPRASSIAPSPTNGRLPDRAAAAIRRANSNSTDATAEHNTSTSAAGRSPAAKPMPGRSSPVSPANCHHAWATSGDADPTAATARTSPSTGGPPTPRTPTPPPITRTPVRLLRERYPGPLTRQPHHHTPVDNPGRP